MEKRYKLWVNDSLQYQFEKEEVEGLDAMEISPAHYHILEGHRSFTGTILKADFLNRKYTVKINSNYYEVDIANELDMLIEDMGLSNGHSLKLNDVKAPMPGLILDVNIKAGDEVKEGDYLLVLEAMKMENTLTAPRDGVVKSISVEKGQSVEKNQLLIEME